MITFNSKSRYGILATLFLAERYGQGLEHIKDIAEKKNIPVQFLAQIFNQLAKSNIIASTRGKKGGYQLSRPPSEITILEILEILEGGIELGEKNNEADDAINDLFLTAEKQLKKILSTTLDDLLTLQNAKKQILHFDI